MQHTDSADTQHEYFADRPGFPAKTIVATLFIGAFFGYLNETLLNVALTPIMHDFAVDKTTAQWLTTGFLLVMGAFTPITANLIQWIETRKIVLITQATFLTGSLICACAPTFAVLLAGRLVQAVSAACFVPLLFNGILAIYPPLRRGTAMGVITMMFTVAPAIGPTITGLILLPASIAEAVAAPLLGRLLDRKGGRYTVLPATILLTASLAVLWLNLRLNTHPLILAATFTLLAVSVSACVTGETHGLNALPKALNPHGAAIIATLNPIAGAIGAAYFIGVTSIGEKLSTAATAQQTMLGGIRLAVGSALILAATTIWLASKLQPNRAE